MTLPVLQLRETCILHLTSNMTMDPSASGEQYTDTASIVGYTVCLVYLIGMIITDSQVGD